MENTSSVIPNGRTYCDQGNDNYQLSSDLDLITSATVLLAVISLFTVFSNCVVIIAIARAYIYGVSSDVPKTKTSPWTVSKGKSFYRSLVKSLKNNTKDGYGDNVEITSSPGPTLGPSSSAFQKPVAAIHFTESSQSLELTPIKSSKEKFNRASGSTEDVLLSRKTSEENCSGSNNLRKASLKTLEEDSKTSIKICAHPSLMFEGVEETSELVITHDNGTCFKNNNTPRHRRTEKVPVLTPFGKPVRLRNNSSSVPIILIFSMAVSDALLGAVIMPLSILEIVNNGEWPYGSMACMLRTTLDVILSTTSIYHVTCMAGDRYLAVCRPFLHRELTVWKGVLATAISWALPVCIVTLFSVFHLVATKDNIDIRPDECLEHKLVQTNMSVFNQSNIILLPKNPYDTSVTERDRRKECSQNFTFSAQAVLVTICFYIPFFIIFLLYFFMTIEIYRVSKNRDILHGASKKQRKRSRCSQFDTTRSAITGHVLPQKLKTSNSKNKQHSEQKHTQTFASTLVESILGGKRYVLNTNERQSSETRYTIEEGSSTMWQNSRQDLDSSIARAVTAKSKYTNEESSTTSTGESGKGSNPIRTPKSTNKTLQAVKTIGLVVVCFTICWLPFSIMVLVASVGNGGVPNWVVLLITWLGYINSSLNPILYCGHRTIRAAIKDLLCGPVRRTA